MPEIAHDVEGAARKRIGPLEAWQIAAGAGALILGYLVYRRSKNGSSTGSAAPSGTSTPGVSNVAPSDLAGSLQGTALGGQLQNLIGGVGNVQHGVDTLIANQPPPVGVPAPQNPPGDAVSRLYGLVGRAPDTQGAGYWTGFLSGHSASQAYSAFSATPEAQAYARSNPQGYVTAQYQELLGHAPDAGGLAYWSGQVAANPAQESAAFLGSAKRENSNL